MSVVINELSVQPEEKPATAQIEAKAATPQQRSAASLPATRNTTQQILREATRRILRVRSH
jgi:hypothetical protein